MRFEEDFETILEKREAEEAVMKRLCTYTEEFRLKLENFIDKKIKKLREQKSKNERIGVTNDQLSQQLKKLESKLEDVILQQKLINKTITNFQTNEATIREDIKEEKSRKEALLEEHNHLTRELRKNAEAVKKEYNTLKMCAAIYKKQLNFHIDCSVENDRNKVKITFLYNLYPDRDNYFVQCLNYETTWKVCSTQPSLDKEYLEEIKLDFNKEYDVHDMTAFLCKIRRKFIILHEELKSQKKKNF